MSKRVLYVNPIQLDANPAIDAIAYGLQHVLRGAGIELRVLFADFREPGYRHRYQAAIEEGIAARVDGMVIYVINPSLFGDAVATARAAGIPVFTFVRPQYPVRERKAPNCGRSTSVTQKTATVPPSNSCTLSSPRSREEPLMLG